ncbi:MAG: UvrD-helicase domain-containing protein [Oscillospiraceae bacterium]|nr:UvrD-helicase domain-containing protein [Oscillospiraceae bacterium]
MAEFHLTEAQARAVSHRDGALLISAGAGSGKTRVLVERLLTRIAGGGDLDRFLIITYTRAAAAELRGRILAALRQRLRSDPSSHLRRQLLLLPQARIGTIHSFCSAVLRENAQLLDIRPDFRLLEGAEERVLRKETLQDILAGRYEDMTSGFQALVDALTGGESDRALSDVVLDTYDAVQSHPDPDAWLTGQMEATVSFADAGETPWGRALLDRAKRLTAFWRGQMEEALESLRTEPKAEAGYGPSLRTTLDDMENFSLALERGWDAAAACEDIRFPPLRGYKGIGDNPAAARVKARRDACRAAMEKLEDFFAENSAAHAEDMAAVSPVTGELLALVRDFSRTYTAEKRRRGVLDFSDLEHLALTLLTEEDRAAPSALGRELSRRFDEILVDEYQDCNRVQDRIFFAVSNGGQNVTMVGDVKQSIYRFRLADPGLFLRKYDSYADDPAPGRGKRILLPENFRSDGGILGPVNQFFSAVMSQELGELDYGEKEALKPGPEAGASEEAFRLFVTEPGENARPEEEAVAGYVAWLLRSGMTVPGPEGDRPLQPGDIAILLRSAKGRDGAYAEALKRLEIPSVCLKSADDLETRPEVSWALSLLQIIDNPRQDIPLLTALRSPVFRFNEDRLAQIRCFRRKGPYYDALKAAAETEEDCRAMLDTLARWRARSALVPAEELLSELCAETGLRALAEAGEPGSAANLDSLIAAAHDYAQGGRADLFSFIACLREARDPKKASVTARPGGGEGVTITTIHGSKGLEYPVVILADLMRRFNLRDVTKPLLIHPDLGVGVRRTDKTRGITYTTLPRLAIGEQLRAESLSEELRVLYVAMTRARQHLALFCRVKDLGKARDSYDTGTGLPLPPEELEKASCPGAWVLTASLALGGQGPWAWRTPPSGERLAQAQEEEASGESVDPTLLKRRLEWQYGRSADTRLPSKLTATSLRSSFIAVEAAEGASPLRRRRYAPEDFPPPVLRERKELSPAEKGSAMHLALQYADLDRCTDSEGAAEALAELEKRRLLTKEQCAAVDPEKLRAFSVSEAMAALRKGKLHREFKFSLLAPVGEFLGEGTGETLLQGVVDLWSELPEGILLLDYKTDRVTPETQADRAKEYEPQLRAYAWALERITGKKVLRRMIWFFATGQMTEVSCREDTP